MLTFKMLLAFCAMAVTSVMATTSTTTTKSVSFMNPHACFHAKNMCKIALTHPDCSEKYQYYMLYCIINSVGCVEEVPGSELSRCFTSKVMPTAKVTVTATVTATVTITVKATVMATTTATATATPKPKPGAPELKPKPTAAIGIASAADPNCDRGGEICKLADTFPLCSPE
ncbi:hypothetical protein BZA05DRAFT_421594 [Tricharina praecox]|uniref:uncharacterized protein n=1 Tax=Tricharina praecox TaxID=43433 RepID=UPI002220D5AE|nr:uncharacterized protein BZA05DRAFT_421594 [Tricharina praecox]KAI5844919.1 hypothetical protein BZA05DRAFT_421594 [Tricharina praecox]